MTSKLQSLSTLTCALLLPVSGLSLADHNGSEHHDEDHHEVHQLEAHQHGVTKLNLVKVGSEVAIEIIAPGADLMGFEHEAKTEQEKQAFAQAKASLENPFKLFSFNSEAQCVIQQSAIETSFTEHEEHEHEEEHAKHDEHEHEHEDEHAKHDGHEHEHEEEHAKHDEHEHEHEEEHAKHEEHEHEGEGHREFTASYHYVCQQDVKSLETQWFAVFPASEKLDVQLINEDKQQSLQLDKDHAQLSF